MPDPDYQRRIQSELTGLMQRWGYSSPEDAFVHFCLGLLPEAEDDEVCADAYCNGPNDLEIDGILIAEGEATTIHFVQCKYGSPESEIDRGQVKEFVDNVIKVLRDSVFAQTGNRGVIRLTRDARKTLAEAPDTPVILSYFNFGRFTPNAIIELEGWRSRFSSETDFVRNFKLYAYNNGGVVEQFRLNVVAEERPPDATLPVVGKQALELATSLNLEIASRVKSAVFTTTAEALGSLRNQEGRGLFSLNVRYSLGPSNEVNEGMRNTIDQQGERDKFWFYNNGVYATCKDFEISPDKDIVSVTGMQVVNGCQTITTFGEKLDEGKTLDDVSVLVRLVAISGAESDQEQKLLGNISKYTNTQNAVKARDLHSNDPVQDKLFDSFQVNEFFGKRYFYERKRGEMVHFSRVAPAMTRGRSKIDNKDAAQATLAFKRLKPSTAKASADLLFRDNYNEIFDENLTRASHIFYSWSVLQEVKPFIKEQAAIQGQEYLSQAHTTLVAFVSYCFRKRFQAEDIDRLSQEFERLGEQNFKAHVSYYLKLAVPVLNDIAVAKYGKTPDENFDARRFFLDKDLFGVIIQKLTGLANMAGIRRGDLWTPP